MPEARAQNQHSNRAEAREHLAVTPCVSGIPAQLLEPQKIITVLLEMLVIMLKFDKAMQKKECLSTVTQHLHCTCNPK